MFSGFSLQRRPPDVVLGGFTVFFTEQPRLAVAVNLGVVVRQHRKRRIAGGLKGRLPHQSRRHRTDAEKEKRFTEQTDRLRKVQDDNYDLMKEKSRIELELQRYKCIRAKCRDRQPPNGF